MITVNNLTYRYPGQEIDTIKRINFQVNKGEIYGFLGPSGAGKSTTQKILIKLLSGYGGEIRVMDHDLKQYGNQYYNNIGVGFELPNHYAKLTGLENLQLFSSFYNKTKINIMDLLDRVGLGNAANQKTQDYSKGMKMRLNFIRALIHDPKILFFDEPTSGLDPVNAKNMKDIIQELKASGKTIFLTTHNMHDADELCDRVAFISQGKIMAEDSPKSLKLQFGKPSLKVEYENGLLQMAEFELHDLGANKKFIDLVNSNKIVSMHTSEATLDEVFIKTTGEKLNLVE